MSSRLTISESSVGPGSTVDIPAGTRHRIECTGAGALVFIEVQHGASFDEDDIIRYEDDYGRTAVTEAVSRPLAPPIRQLLLPSGLAAHRCPAVPDSPSLSAGTPRTSVTGPILVSHARNQVQPLAPTSTLARPQPPSRARGVALARIFIVGSGVVGTATGKGFIEAGHTVTFIDVSLARLELLRAEASTRASSWTCPTSRRSSS